MTVSEREWKRWRGNIQRDTESKISKSHGRAKHRFKKLLQTLRGNEWKIKYRGTGLKPGEGRGASLSQEQQQDEQRISPPKQ